MPTYRFTQKQYDELIRRKKELEETLIPQNSIEIEKAKEFGDLKENAEFHSAKERHAELLQELNQIGHHLDYAMIIKANDKFDEVEIGHTVTLVQTNGDDSFSFKLIGQDGDGVEEIDVNSLIGKNVLGKRIGDTITIESKHYGELQYKVTTIQ